MDGPSENSIRRTWENLSPSTLLYTSDNRPLIVLSPGTPNSDGGPDYADALIRLDGRLYRGDVEVHGNERDWLLHGHHTDTHYNKVVLHVVGCRSRTFPGMQTAARRIIPTLVLPAHGPMTEAIRSSKPSRFCTIAPDAFSHPGALKSLHKKLQDLGWQRLEQRILTLRARLDELLRDVHWRLHEAECRYETIGPPFSSPDHPWTQRELESDCAWDQLVYEGIVEGLGYAKNKQAFRALAQNLPLNVLRRLGVDDHEMLCGLLFGVAGLLPSTRGLPDRESRKYVLRLRRCWKTLHRTVRSPGMHEADWLFFRLRPVNFPTARIAALSYLLPRLLEPGTMQRIVTRLSEPDLSLRERLEQLRQLFAFSPDGYWETHLHFRGTGPGPSVALGIDRIDTIIFNTLLPLAILRARLLNDRPLSTSATSLARIMPALARNSITRRIEEKILQGRMRIDTALLQHGVLELGKRYCDAGKCGQCPVLQTLTSTALHPPPLPPSGRGERGSEGASERHPDCHRH